MSTRSIVALLVSWLVGIVGVGSRDASAALLYVGTFGSIPVGQFVYGMAIDSANGLLYVATLVPCPSCGHLKSVVAVVDVVTRTVVANIDPGGDVYELAMNPGATRLYATDFANDKTYVFD